MYLTFSSGLPKLILRAFCLVPWIITSEETIIERIEKHFLNLGFRKLRVKYNKIEDNLDQFVCCKGENMVISISKLCLSDERNMSAEVINHPPCDLRDSFA